MSLYSITYFAAMASLSVAGGQESESLARHLKVLGGVEDAEDAVAGLLHQALEELARPAGVAAAEAQAGRTRAQDDVAGAAKVLLVEVWRRGLTAAQIAADLEAAGVDAAGAARLGKMMHGAVHARRGEIGHALRRKTTEISSGTLEDFDWSLRLCMGSDQLATLRRPLLLLSLTIRKTDGDVEKRTLELSAKELDEMMNSFGDIATCIGKLI